MNPTLYDILGVSPGADAGTIRTAYRRLVMKWHPDRNPGDEDAAAKFRTIQIAFEVLIDPERRLRYDQTGDAGTTTKTIDPLTGAALWMLTQSFAALFKAMATMSVRPGRHDMVKKLRDVISQTAAEFATEERELEAVLRLIQETKGRFTVADGDENYLDSLLKEQDSLAEARLAWLQEQGQIIGRALQILEKQKYRMDGTGARDTVMSATREDLRFHLMHQYGG